MACEAPCPARWLAVGGLWAVRSSDLGPGPLRRLLLQQGQRVPLLDGAQLLLLRPLELGGVSDLRAHGGGQALMGLQSPPAPQGKGGPGRDLGRWAGQEGHTHHLDYLCLALVLQAAFQVLGPALLLLLQHTGEGGLGLGAEAAPVSQVPEQRQRAEFPGWAEFWVREKDPLLPGPGGVWGEGREGTVERYWPHPRRWASGPQLRTGALMRLGDSDMGGLTLGTSGTCSGPWNHSLLRAGEKGWALPSFPPSLPLKSLCPGGGLGRVEAAEERLWFESRLLLPRQVTFVKLFNLSVLQLTPPLK